METVSDIVLHIVQESFQERNESFNGNLVLVEI